MPSRIRGTVSDNPDFEVELAGVWTPYSPKAVVSATTGAPSTANYTDASGQVWDYWRWTGTGSVTFSQAGKCRILLVGGGGTGGTSGGFVGGCGGGGAVIDQYFQVDAATYDLTVSAQGGGNFSTFVKSGVLSGLHLIAPSGGNGGSSGSAGGVGSSGGGGSNASGGGAGFAAAFGGVGTNYASGGAGGAATANTAGGIGAGIVSNITGSSVTYGEGNYTSGSTPGANTGKGGVTGGNGAAGVVILSVAR